MKLYPLTFQPILKERIWGGTKLKEILGKPGIGDTIGESWELSAVEGDISVVANGPLKGKTLRELVDRHGAQLLGKSVLNRFGHDFPILVKFIDAKLDLSIQLHPNDELARKRHGSFGKTEMWYILDADPEAELIVGFNRDVSREAFRRSLEEDSLQELLNYEPVKEGDTFFINTGKIHAIGAGILLAEIQQTSDITYRVFDFNRLDQHGNKRELHTELAMDAMDYSCKNDFRVSYSREADKIQSMVHSRYFNTDYLELTHDYELDTGGLDSFTILVCVAGLAVVSNEAGSVQVARGETVLLPASSRQVGIQTAGAKLLKVNL